MLMTFVLVMLITATVVSDYFGEPPTYLTGLLGTAAGVWFAAIGSDKRKRDDDVAATAHRAEAKADRLGCRCRCAGHPEIVERITPPFDPGTIDPGTPQGESP